MGITISVTRRVLVVLVSNDRVRQRIVGEVGELNREIWLWCEGRRTAVLVTLNCKLDFMILGLVVNACLRPEFSFPTNVCRSHRSFVDVNVTSGRAIIVGIKR